MDAETARVRKVSANDAERKAREAATVGRGFAEAMASFNVLPSAIGVVWIETLGDPRFPSTPRVYHFFQVGEGWIIDSNYDVDRAGSLLLTADGDLFEYALLPVVSLSKSESKEYKHFAPWHDRMIVNPGTGEYSMAPERKRLSFSEAPGPVTFKGFPDDFYAAEETYLKPPAEASRTGWSPSSIRSQMVRRLRLARDLGF